MTLRTDNFERVEPLIYRIVELGINTEEDPFVKSLNNFQKPSNFYALSVKAIYTPFHIDRQIAIDILNLCTGVFHLVFWVICDGIDMELMEVMCNIRPRMLAIRLKNLLGTEKPNFTLPLFRYVTHLDITESAEDWLTWSGFHLLPNLTHILFSVTYGEDYLPGLAAIFHELLIIYRQLKVCVLRIQGSRFAPSLSQIFDCVGSDDPRVVFVVEENCNLDWRAYISGENDTWAYAETVVEQQRRGQRETNAHKVYNY